MKKAFCMMLCVCVTSAYADIYKYVDAQGNVTYSSEPKKGATRLKLQAPVSESDASAQVARSAAETTFPRVDGQEQKLRDQERRKILQQELAAERSALAQAKKAHEEAGQNPEVFRTTVDGKVVTRRNVAKFEEKMKPLQEDIDLHERNIQMLESKLNSR